MTVTETSRRSQLPTHLIIFLTGFTFLLYEVSWNRLLSLVLGATVTASTIVLATFMAGFGTGALVWGRWANSRQAVGPILGALLAGIGLFSGINYWMLTQVVPKIFSNGTGDLPVFALTAVLLFIPAFFMGGVFPLVSKLAVSSDQEMAATLGRLYAIETLGSTVGGLLTGFFLLGTLGQQKTILLAAVVNLVLGSWLAVSPVYRLRTMVALPTKKENGGSHPLQRPALLGAFICGLSILGLQVLWMRMFRIYLTNTSYTFALVSSVAIMGLFFGSFLFGRRHQGRDMQKTLFRVLLGVLVSTGLGLILLVNLPQLLMFPFVSVMGSPFARAMVLPLVAALLIIFPPAAFSGYAFPLACRMYAGGAKNISRDVGLVLMVNTTGSVLGPLLAAFVFLPLLGSVMSVLLLMALLGAAALVILRWRGAGSWSGAPRNSLIVSVALLLLLVVLSPNWRILPPSFSRFDREILHYRESVEGTLTVGRDRGTRSRSKYTYVNNSAVIGSTYDAVKVVKMVGHFPFLLGLEAQDVLVIGFGIGVTTSAIASHPEVRSIECVELVPGLQDAARYYLDLNHRVVDDPRLKLIPGDGRHYLQTTTNKYDLISCDPTHPILGSGSLYTADYFQQCKEHLNPGGMVSQYLPLHKLRPEEFAGIVRTFQSVFPNSTLWLGHYHAVLLGGTDSLEIEFKIWSDNVQKLGKDEHFYVNAYHLAATLMLDGPAIEELWGDRAINTDDLSYTEFFDTDCLLEENIGLNLQMLMDSRSDNSRIFLNNPRPDLMGRYLEGHRLLTESLHYRLLRDNVKSQQLMKQAMVANPEDQEFPFLLRLYY